MSRRTLPFWTFFVAAIGAVLPVANAHLTGQVARPSGLIALRGGTILTVTQGTIPNGTIVLRDGKIAAVGANVTIPAGAEVIDVTGKFISPGIIDCHSHIANDDINEGGTTVSSMTGMRDVLNPTDINIYRDLAGGLTTANVLHGSANPIGGKNQVIKLRWGKTRAEDLVFEGALPGIKFALGENPKRPARSGQSPARAAIRCTRMGVEYVIRDAFTRAKAYQKAWQDYDDEEGGRTGRAAAAARPAARAAGRDPRGQAPGARAQLPRRRDPDADPRRRRDGLQDRDVPARARGLQSRQGNRGARRRRLDVLRLVGLQGRGGRTRFPTTPRS